MDADAATLVWIAPTPADAEQARALSSFGRAYGIRLVAPREETAPALPYDPRIGDDVERLLDRARDAQAGRDAEAVDRLLGAAESTVRAHPEVPQAAWLMAEVERARSSRLRRIAPIDEPAATAAWGRADALDGGRVAGVAELSTPAPPAATLMLPSGLTRGITMVRLDGTTVAGQTIVTRAGPHALVVEVGGAPVWASWIVAPPGMSVVQVPPPPGEACSRSDVLRAAVAGGGVDASGVRCRSWIAAVPAGDGVLVAVCTLDHCGTAVEWRAPLPWSYDLPPERAAPHFPAWATWGLVGAGAIVTTGIVILATGVLKPAPTETQFVTGGSRTQ